MDSVFLLLDEIPAGSEPDPGSGWFGRIAESLDRDPEAWMAAIVGVGELSDAHGWSLLSWVEVAASQVVRTRSSEVLVRAVFAMALVLESALDPRDCAIVGSLLRRACILVNLDYAACVIDGCNRAGVFGPRARDFLEHVSVNLPSTHFESGVGETFMFSRYAPDFDVADLERWLKGEGS